MIPIFHHVPIEKLIHQLARNSVFQGLVGEHPVEFVGASDVRGAALGRRAVIRHAEVQRFVALGGGGDGVDVHHAFLCGKKGEITKRNDDLPSGELT